jgi:hypothetical protein
VNWIEAYLAAVEQALLLMVPASLMVTVYAWLLVWRYRGQGVWLPIVLASACTIAGACTTWLSFTVLYRSRVGPVPTELLPVTASVVLLLNVIPLIAIGYLIALDIMDIRLRS